MGFLDALVLTHLCTEKVAYTFPGYTGPTYKDYSVRWWKKYYHLASQCNTLDPQVIEHSKLMMLLHHQEICGLHIDGNAIKKIGNPTPNKLTSDFEYDPKKPAVLNNHLVYAEFDVQDCSDQFELAGLSQVTSVSCENVIDQAVKKYNHGKQQYVCPDPYRYLIMTFKELTNVYRGNTDEEALSDIRNYMNSLISEKKKEIFLEKSKLREEVNPKQAGLPVPIGTYISSNVSNSKKRKKHHGCRGY